MMRMMRILTVLWVVLGGIRVASAATYYVTVGGSDGSTCAQAQSLATAKASLASAWGCLSAGDTLLVGDGSYADASPPADKAGMPGAPITVQAMNDGGARLTGGVAFRGNSYLRLTGFAIVGDGSAVDVVSNGTGKVSHHLEFRRIGFSCTDTTLNDGACFGLSDGTHHVLLEDSWGWGGGRYTVLAYGGPGGSPPNTSCDSNTFRRLVLRMGPSTSTGGNPQAALALYYASNNLVENVIAVDGKPASDSSNAAFYLTTHAAPPNLDGNKFYGVIALHNTGTGWYLDHNGSGSNNELHDSVFWDNAEGVALYAAGTCAANTVDHVTVGKNNGDGLYNGCTATTVRSSIFTRNTGDGLHQGSQGSSTANWNDFFQNAGATGSAGANDLTNDPGLVYIARTEPGTPCKGMGQGGTDCGADVTVRYEDGVRTTTSLWPWPHEARIQADMCVGAGITTGFCAKTSITEYVWTYLGGTNPYAGQLPPSDDLGAPTSADGGTPADGGTASDLGDGGLSPQLDCDLGGAGVPIHGLALLALVALALVARRRA